MTEQKISVTCIHCKRYIEVEKERLKFNGGPIKESVKRLSYYESVERLSYYFLCPRCGNVNFIRYADIRLFDFN